MYVAEIDGAMEVIEASLVSMGPISRTLRNLNDN